MNDDATRENEPRCGKEPPKWCSIYFNEYVCHWG